MESSHKISLVILTKGACRRYTVVEVTSQITSGKIGGLINLRDTVLTGAQT